MPLVPFATKTEPDAGYSGERCLNVFPRAADGVSQAVLLGRGGAEVHADLGGAVRALQPFNGSLYAVANGALQRFSNGSVTSIGNVGNSDVVHMDKNASQIAMVVGDSYYVYDGYTVASYDTGAIDRPVDLAYFGGYMVLVGEGQGRKDTLSVSRLDDAKDFTLFDFATAEQNPDRIVGCGVNGSRLYLFGSDVTEEWYVTSDADFPLASTGRVLEAGLYDSRAIAKEDNGLFFLAEDLIVHRTSGAVPPVISERAIEAQIANLTPYTAFTFQERGHKHFALRMTTGVTYVYDITQRRWHERSTGVSDGPWFVTCAATLNGVQYFGTDTGKIITLTQDVFDDDGQTVVADATSAPFYEPDGLHMTRVHALFAGGNVDLERTPQVALQTSRDGLNWARERWRDLPKLGQHGRSVEWHGLGYFPDRAQVRWTITDPVPRDCYGVSYDTA